MPPITLPTAQLFQRAAETAEVVDDHSSLRQALRAQMPDLEFSIGSLGDEGYRGQLIRRYDGALVTNQAGAWIRQHINALKSPQAVYDAYRD